LVRFDFSSLDDDEFEELAKEIMRRKGFQNVQRISGPGSGDLGRDLTAEENLTSITHTTIQTKILVQCKNYGPSRTTIGPSVVETLANRARSLQCNRILIITSHDLTSTAKAVATSMINNPQWNILAEWWNVHDLTGFLMQYPDLVRRFSLRNAPARSLNVGILDGYATDRVNEKPCLPTFSNVSAKDWGTMMQTGAFSISFISSSEIDNSYDAILNPFGETYPEENYASLTTYLRILNYVTNGGLFVNVAGFPFFYYWNHDLGRSVTVTRPTYVFNPATNEIIGFYNFDDTLLYRDFRISLDGRSPTEVTIFQMDADKRRAGDLVSLGIERVIQFRAVKPGNENIIPLVRAENGRIFPIAAIRHSSGHLIISGLDLHLEQAPLVLCAVKNWLLTNGGEFSLSQQ
jgi:hypothetical protein